MYTKVPIVILFLLLFLTTQCLTAQDQHMADSLIQVFENASKRDTSRLMLLTLIAQNQNDPRLKLKYSEFLMDEAREAKRLKFLHHAYLQQGQAYRLMGDFEVAIYSLFKALDYAEQAKFGNGIAGAHTALADVYSIIGNNSNATLYYKKSITYLRRHDSTQLANALLNLGDEYYMAKMFDSALICFEESKRIYELVGANRSGLAYNLGNMGLVLAEMDQLELAETNVRNSIRELEALNDHYGMAIFLTYMSEIYQRKGLLAAAKTFADSSMVISTKYGLKTEIRDNSLRLADIYAMSADYETAYKFHRRYVELKDSIADDDIYTRIENLKGAFELAKKQTEVDLLTAEKKNQQILMAAIILVSLVVTLLAIVIFSYYRSKARVNRILEEQKRSLESLNHTKDKYFSIISHDLRGSVSSFFGISRMIKYLVGQKDTKQLLEVASDIDQSVERLSNLLDNLLAWAMQQQERIPIRPEVLNVKEAVDSVFYTLSNLAKGKQIHLTSDIEAGLKLYADKNTTMTILRNLVSNSLKFTEEGGRVSIRAFSDAGKTVVEVADNGVGIPKEKMEILFNPIEDKSTYGTSGEKGLGLGLQLVYEFVKMNQGEIEVGSSVGKGTTFVFKLPSNQPEALSQT